MRISLASPVDPKTGEQKCIHIRALLLPGTFRLFLEQLEIFSVALFLKILFGDKPERS